MPRSQLRSSWATGVSQLSPGCPVKYQCRMLNPIQTAMVEIEADSPEDAAKLFCEQNKALWRLGSISLVGVSDGSVERQFQLEASLSGGDIVFSLVGPRVKREC